MNPKTFLSSHLLSFSRYIAIILFLSHLAWAGKEKPLLENGDFEKEASEGKSPLFWGLPTGSSWETQKKNHFLRLKVDHPGQTVSVYRKVPVDAKIEALEVSYKVRYENVVTGEENWHDGRIVINFLGKNGEKLGSGPVAVFRGTQKDWKEGELSFVVPSGTENIEFMPSLFQVKSGQVDLDDIDFKAVKAKSLKKKAK